HVIERRSHRSSGAWDSGNLMAGRATVLLHQLFAVLRVAILLFAGGENQEQYKGALHVSRSSKRTPLRRLLARRLLGFLPSAIHDRSTSADQRHPQYRRRRSADPDHD